MHSEPRRAILSDESRCLIGRVGRVGQLCTNKRTIQGVHLMLLWQSGRHFCGNPVDAFVAIRSALLWQSGRCFCGNPVNAFVAAEGDAAKECSSLYMQGHQIGVRSCRTGRTSRTGRTAQIECLHTYRAGEGQAAQIGGAPEPGRGGWRMIAGERELGGAPRRAGERAGGSTEEDWRESWGEHRGGLERELKGGPRGGWCWASDSSDKTQPYPTTPGYQ